MEEEKVDVEESLLAELEISSDLGYEFTRQAPFYAHWAFLHAKAEDMVRKAEERTDIAFAQLYRAYRQKVPDAKENDCKSYIRTHVDHKKRIKELNRAKYNRDMLKAAVRAFDMRHSMLIQLGLDRRREMDEIKQTENIITKKAKRASKIVRRTYDSERGVK